MCFESYMQVYNEKSCPEDNGKLSEQRIWHDVPAERAVDYEEAEWLELTLIL